jgi:Baseplate J-like protein
MIFQCSSERRRSVLRDNPGSGLNGIDYLEVRDDDAMADADRQRLLTLHFVNPVPFTLTEADLIISGGERVREIAIDGDPTPIGDRVFEIKVDRRGDFSPYTFTFAAGKRPPSVDPQLAEIAFTFKAGCPNPFDCAADEVCPPKDLAEPAIDYLAKDYSTFRRLMLDRIALVMPNWTERNPADYGIAVVEMLAYVGDYLSYEQDAVATEAYLGSARRRTSVRRHARLLDYPIDDGRNARAWVQVRVDTDATPSGTTAVLPAGTKFMTRIEGQPTRLTEGSRAIKEMENSGSETFESLHDIDGLYVDHNKLRFYTWGGDRCCLPAGATSATLRGEHPDLKPGMILVLVEERGAITGDEADADPANRHAVRLKTVTAATDALGGLLEPGGPIALLVTEIAWDDGDALPFPLCLATAGAEGSTIEDVSIALGNIVLVDHGRTIENEDLGTVPLATLVPAKTSTVLDPCGEGPPPPIPARYAPQLQNWPVTQAMWVRIPGTSSGAANKLAPFNDQRPAVEWLSPPDAITLPSVWLTDDRGIGWTSRRDLLRSGTGATDFVIEVEEDARATIRFGDDHFGKRPDAGSSFLASYRVGNGRRGNVGAGAIGHVVTTESAVVAVNNPIGATGGSDPERLEDVRQRAPAAFRRQERAVTAADYAAVAERHPDVQRAAATFRWTGSWRTIFLTIDRRAGLQIDADFEHEIRLHLERFRMAGHDVEIDGPRLAPLEIVLFVCVAPHARPSAVREELLDLFSARVLPDGRRGLFHPDNVTFGQSVFLSKLYEAALAVQGVAQARFTTFQRWQQPSTAAFDDGELSIGRLEIASVENNPNFPERGILTVDVEAL